MPAAALSFVQVVGGQYAAYALGSDGNAYGWGYNAYGAAGDGTTTDRYTPVRVKTWPTVTEVSFGGVAGTGLTSQPDGTWTVQTPPGCGPVDVVVSWTQLGAAHADTYPGGFVYGAAPAITVQPVSGSVEHGGTFTAQVAASGDDVPAIQWQEQDAGGGWVDLPGETTEVLTVSGVQAERQFRAVATNCWGVAAAAVSDVATVTPVNGDATGPGDGADGAGASDGAGDGDGAGGGGVVPDADGGAAVPGGPLALTGGRDPRPWLAAGIAVLVAGAALTMIGRIRIRP